MKDTLRKKMHILRDERHLSGCHTSACDIESRLFSLPEFKSAKTILFYASTGSEVPTIEMIGHALASGKRVILPITHKGPKRLELSEILSAGELANGTFGVPEPTVVRKVSKDALQIAIVPGLAFDRSGHRLGYGMGYYDGLLRHVQIPIIGLAYSFQIVETVHHKAHDVPVHRIVTEAGIIDCEK
jgi:5-formyltetrahydrofolate cyclo-ligase